MSKPLSSYGLQEVNQESGNYEIKDVLELAEEAIERNDVKCILTLILDYLRENTDPSTIN